MTPATRSPVAAARAWWRYATWLLLLTSVCEAAVNSTEHASVFPLAVGGSHKAIVGVQALRQQGIYPADMQPFTEQRFRLQGTVGGDWIVIAFANELSAFFQRPNEPGLPVPDGTPPAAWNARWRLYDDPRQGLSLIERIDRLYAQVTLGGVELIVGKQVVPLGVGHLFSAISQTPRLAFVIVDPEYQNTEDAVTARWNSFATFEARYLPRTPGQRGDNFHLRMKGNVAGYDAAVIGGRSDDKIFAGIEAAGNVGDQVLRGEIVAYTRDGRSWMQALAGLDTVFSARWSAQFEVFYNGFGAEPGTYSLEAPRHRSAPYRGRWYVGSVVAWEMGQRWKASLAALANVVDPSVLTHASVSYSWGPNLDLIAGQYLGVGSRDAEFGGTLPVVGPTLARLGLPNLTYALLKYSF